jgi:hypothetical protein
MDLSGWDFRFSCRRVWRWLSSGMLRRVVWWKFTIVMSLTRTVILIPFQLFEVMILWMTGSIHITIISKRTELTPWKSSYREASSRSAREIHRHLWKADVHYRVHKNPPLDSLLRPMNPVDNIISNFFSSLLKLYSHLRLFPRGLSRSGFSTKIVH